MQKIIIFFFILVSVSITSCKKIDELPVNNLVAENVITNQESAQVALNGIYSYLGVYGTWDGYMISDNALRSNLVEASTQRSSYELELIAMDEQTDWVYIKNLWQDIAKVINAANNFIFHTEALPESKFSTNKKKEMLGEAYFMRGFATLYQMKMFAHFWDTTSEYGPLLRTEPSGLNNNYKARSTVTEGYDQIISDFKFAAENAPQFYSVFRASSAVAKAYWAETLLMRGSDGDYAEAANLCKDVISTSGLTLQSNFSDIYTSNYQSTELLFSRQIDKVEAEDFINSVPSIYSLFAKKRNAPSEMYFNYLDTTADTRAPAIIGTTSSTNAQGVVVTYANSWLKHWNENGDVPMRYMRLSQLYLYEAEALLRSGAPVSEVIVPLNVLLARDGMPLINESDILNRSDLYDIIFTELIVEVGVENGCEFFAAVRFKDSQGNRKIKDLNPAFESDNQLVLPIPDAELNFNPKMIQNPK